MIKCSAPGARLLVSEYPDERQVAVIVVVIQAIADHEDVGDDESAVIGLDGDDLAANLAEEYGGADGCGTPVLDMLDQGGEGLSGVEDVVEQQDVAAGDVGRERFIDDEGRGRGRLPPVAAGLHQSDPQGNADPADQVRQGDQAAG